ncbi:hypothetical protein BaRGS_00015205 [Batillaria attramentaria]|uniref:Uncharacterized protein n=1 Tax=Batillaria attramentaria TaxID=370345 RepID=A0ABD0L2X8_9CAEN
MPVLQSDWTKEWPLPTFLLPETPHAGLLLELQGAEMDLAVGAPLSATGLQLLYLLGCAVTSLSVVNLE